MTNVLNVLKKHDIDIQSLMKTMSIEKVKEQLIEIISNCKKETLKKPTPIHLERGFAVVPLKGIDVPFHSTFLRSGVKPFRSFLMKNIHKTSVDPSKLIGKYIPNVTAQPFEISKEYFEEVYKLTNSPRIAKVLEDWDKYSRDSTDSTPLPRRLSSAVAPPQT